MARQYHLLEVRAGVAVLPRELQEFGDFASYFALFWCADDPDAASGAHLKQSLVAQSTQRPQGGVGVDSHHRGEVAGGREPVAGVGFAVDRTADFCRDLLVQAGWIVAVDLDSQQCDIQLAHCDGCPDSFPAAIYTGP